MNSWMALPWEVLSAPVSYTHLDVYKRQQHSTASSLSLFVLNWQTVYAVILCQLVDLECLLSFLCSINTITGSSFSQCKGLTSQFKVSVSDRGTTLGCTTKPGFLLLNPHYCCKCYTVSRTSGVPGQTPPRAKRHMKQLKNYCEVQSTGKPTYWPADAKSFLTF